MVNTRQTPQTSALTGVDTPLRQRSCGGPSLRPHRGDAPLLQQHRGSDAPLPQRRNDDALPRRRLGALEREQQILDGAIDFFARRGLDAQMRELAAELGIAHTLLYHYFPTKRELIERVYEHTIAGRWDSRWERLLDDKRLPTATKLLAFYREYLAAILTPEWLRILVHSGLSDGLIPNRYFALVREKLFPRLLRELRRAAGSRSRTSATAREEALLMAFHGGLIYHLGIWPLVYQQSFSGQDDAAVLDGFIQDRIHGLLLQAPHIVGTQARRAAVAAAGATTAARSTKAHR